MIAFIDVKYRAGDTAGQRAAEKSCRLPDFVRRDWIETDGLEHLRGATRLKRLFLDRTRITDAGMAHLRGLTQLEALTLDQLVEDGGYRDATREVLVHVDNNALLYNGYLARMLATRDQWLPFVGGGQANGGNPGELREHLELDVPGLYDIFFNVHLVVA